MSRYPTNLEERATGSIARGMIDDFLPLDALFTAEEQWCLTRIEIFREIAIKALSQDEWPGSLHWNWASKAAALGFHRLEESGDARLFGIEGADRWQGLLLALSENRFTHLGELNWPLVYVDFIESAPWNWEIKPLNRTGRFRGVGLQLMELAIRWSLSLGYDGRVGLHSLKQSERYYTSRCHMSYVGIDPEYQNLSYFELTEAAAEDFLRNKLE